MVDADLLPSESETITIALAGVGAAAKATIEDWINKQFPTFPVEYSGIVAGFLLWRYGSRVHEYLKYFGAGVLIGSIGQLDIIKGLIPSAGSSPSGGSSPNEQPALAIGDFARIESARTVVTA